jgi:CheY-like chemotaxis protein
MTTKSRILCVDDEPNVLDSFRRLLRKDFDLNTARSGADGLKLMEQNGPYAVVVSDFKMPGMNGVEFLTKAREIDTDTVRVMLTGQAEETTAAKAINDGKIFRFLYKPIASSEFLKCLGEAIHQYNLLNAEKEILEKTLKGSIEMMTEILSLSNPLAFSRATRVQRFAQQVGTSIGMDDIWQLEVASMLSHLGYVTIPAKTLEKKAGGGTLGPLEYQMFEDLPGVTQKLIGHIPRLENVLKIITQAFRQVSFETISLNDSVAVASAILRTVTRFDELIEKGYGKLEAIKEMMMTPERFNQSILDQLKHINIQELCVLTRKVSINQIRVGMILNESIKTTEGLTVAPKGFKVNDLIRQLLKNLHLQDTIPEYVEVMIDDRETGE